jgi:membrane-bound metal-dependent hydrolase YbcI (DUF457 family)
MPNRDEHDTLGVVYGPLASLAFEAKYPTDHIEQSLPTLLGRLAGMMAGGVLGSRAPDKIDKPNSPRHRGIAHAVIPQLLALLLVIGIGLGLREYLLRKADELAEKRREPGCTRFDEVILAFLEFAAGFLAEFPIAACGGDVSHLLADAGTPAGLNLLGPGE